MNAHSVEEFESDDLDVAEFAVAAAKNAFERDFPTRWGYYSYGDNHIAIFNNHPYSSYRTLRMKRRSTFATGCEGGD